METKQNLLKAKKNLSVSKQQAEQQLTHGSVGGGDGKKERERPALRLLRAYKKHSVHAERLSKTRFYPIVVC